MYGGRVQPITCPHRKRPRACTHKIAFARATTAGNQRARERSQPGPLSTHRRVLLDRALYRPQICILQVNCEAGLSEVRWREVSWTGCRSMNGRERGCSVFEDLLELFTLSQFIDPFVSKPS